MSDKSVPLSSDEKSRLEFAVEATFQNNVPAYAVTGPLQPHVRVFYAAFDGTNNDRDNIPAGEQPSLVADMEKRLAKNTSIESHYYAGVGTRSIFPFDKIEQATGLGAIQRAERAYADLQAATARWKAEDPDVTVHVHATGFSRGAATGLHFLNLVHADGADGRSGSRHPDASGVPFRQSAVLFDIVATGQTDDMRLSVPPSVVGLLHLVAEDESRRAFSLISVQDPGRTRANLELASNVLVTPQFTGMGHEGAPYRANMALYTQVRELELPGRHSDIGGTYGSGGIRNAVGYIASEFHAQLGLDTPFVKPTPEAIQAYFAHDSRWEVDKVLDKVTGPNVREVHVGTSPTWDGRANLMLLKVETPTLPFNPLVEPVQLDKNLSQEIFKQDYSLKVYLDDQNQVRYVARPASAFSYDKDGDRMLFLGQATEALGVTSHLSQHLKEGAMSFELALQRPSLTYDPTRTAAPAPLAAPATQEPSKLERFLSKSEPDIILDAKSGSTPLMVAARAGLPDAVAALLEKGADPSARNSQGKTAEDLALLPDIKVMLREAQLSHSRPESTPGFER